MCFNYNKRIRLLKLLYAAYVLIRIRRLRLRCIEYKKRMWERSIFKNKHLGEYNHLLERLCDREYHFRYLRMSKERFDHLFNLVEPLVAKKDTRFRQGILARKRLTITLRYLATGCYQQTLSYAFRDGRSILI